MAKGFKEITCTTCKGVGYTYSGNEWEGPIEDECTSCNTQGTVFVHVGAAKQGYLTVFMEEIN